MPVGLLQAAAVLLEAGACQSDDEQLRVVAEETLAHLRHVMKPPSPLLSHDPAWFAKRPAPSSYNPEDPSQ
ncbi:hypothetical protein ABT213_33445 [Streptomyces sp. NPDC001674]|uniref:hypothetical protein n=1 Tax=Streptomyces sp. NPDC001674 TaxID=3154394 RepID=UPI00332BE185